MISRCSTRFDFDFGVSSFSTTARGMTSSEAESDDYDSDERYYRDNQPHTRLRRGSEGVEVAMSPADREDILRRYILTRGEEAGSYRKHVPEEVPAKSDPASENARHDKIKRN